MPSSTDNRTSYFLGRRVERLFFSGFVLILLCFVEAYLSTAAAHFAKGSPITALTALISRLEPEQARLEELFNRELRLATESLETAAIRKRLGLDPKFRSKDDTSSRPYSEELHKMVDDANRAEIGRASCRERV